jgi:hypothetical protein
MRKLFIFLGLATSMYLSAQVEFSHSFDFSVSQANLETLGKKFYLMDPDKEQCRIYNEDYTLETTFQFNIPDNQFLADIAFVSQNVFDSDDGIELLIVYYKYFETQTSYYYQYTTDVIDDDGSILLSVPGGSYSDILNNPGPGSSLMIYVYDYSSWPYDVETRIYSLPGKLTGLDTDNRPLNEMNQDINAYPNPTSGNFTVEMPQELLSQQAKLFVRNMSGELVYQTQLANVSPEHQVNLSSLPSGVYFFELQSSKLTIKGKRIIKK